MIIMPIAIAAAILNLMSQVNSIDYPFNKIVYGTNVCGENQPFFWVRSVKFCCESVKVLGVFVKVFCGFCVFGLFWGVGVGIWLGVLGMFRIFLRFLRAFGAQRGGKVGADRGVFPVLSVRR